MQGSKILKVEKPRTKCGEHSSVLMDFVVLWYLTSLNIQVFYSVGVNTPLKIFKGLQWNAYEEIVKCICVSGSEGHVTYLAYIVLIMYCCDLV